MEASARGFPFTAWMLIAHGAEIAAKNVYVRTVPCVAT
jgi:hypothetical protein